MLASFFVLAATLPVAAGQDDPLTAAERDWLREHESIRVAVPHNSPPLSFVDANGTVTRGMAVDLLRLAALKVGVQMTFVSLPVPNYWTALKTGDADIIAIAGARADLIDHAAPTEPIFWPGNVFVARANRTDIAAASDFDGLHVGVQAGSVFETLLVESFPAVIAVPLPTQDDAVAATMAGEVDGAFGSQARIGYLLGREAISLRPVGDPVAVSEASAWGLPDSPALAIVKKGFARVTAGERDLILVKWTGFTLADPNALVPAAPTPAWIRWTLWGLVGAILISGSGALLLRREVNRRTNDVQELNRTLEARVQERTEALEESAREWQGFAYSLNHDIRAPVRHITGFSELLLADAAGKLNDDELQYLRRVHEAAGRLHLMIEGLGTLSRLNQEPLVWSSVDVTAAAHAAIANIEEQAPDRHVEWEIQAGIRVAGDAALVALALHNLLDNAHKYSATREVAHVRLRAQPDGHRVRLIVEDDGVGFDTARGDLLWQPLQRLHGREFPGTGIGLATVRRIVRHHGGAVSAGLSDDLGGARFEVTLPHRPNDTSGPTGRAGKPASCAERGWHNPARRACRNQSRAGHKSQGRP